MSSETAATLAVPLGISPIKGAQLRGDGVSRKVTSKVGCSLRDWSQKEAQDAPPELKVACLPPVFSRSMKKEAISFETSRAGGPRRHTQSRNAGDLAPQEPRNPGDLATQEPSNTGHLITRLHLVSTPVRGYTGIVLYITLV